MLIEHSKRLFTVVLLVLSLYSPALAACPTGEEEQCNNNVNQFGEQCTPTYYNYIPEHSYGWVSNRNQVCDNFNLLFYIQENDILYWPEGTYTAQAFYDGISCAWSAVVQRDWGTTSSGGYIWTKFTGMAGYKDSSNVIHIEDYVNSFGCRRPTVSPIIIAFSSTVEISSPENGVRFDFENNGMPLQVGWPISPEVAWLVRGTTIESSAKMFGNLSGQATPIYPEETRNGFRALRWFDVNHDNRIDGGDPIFAELNLWFDWNRNAIAERGELESLSNRGITSIEDLDDYANIGRKDKFGNELRNRGKVKLTNGKTVFAYDLFPAIGDTLQFSQVL